MGHPGLRTSLLRLLETSLQTNLSLVYNPFNEASEEDTPDISADQVKMNLFVTDLPCQCTSCFNDILTDDDKLRDIKYWIKQIEGGLTVEYRCPVCRDCTKCKDSDTTEKVSLREEVEQKQIVDNVTLDLEQKRIPMRTYSHFI